MCIATNGCKTNRYIKQLQLKSIRQPNVQYWLNENEQLVGVCVNFELADDVHYELNTENWFRFLREVLFIAPSSNCVVPFRDFLNTAAPQVGFGMVLNAKRIE